MRRLVTDAVSVGYYSLTLSTALISPFISSFVADISPPPTLFEQSLKTTTLNHRFMIFNFLDFIIDFSPCQDIWKKIA